MVANELLMSYSSGNQMSSDSSANSLNFMVPGGYLPRKEVSPLGSAIAPTIVVECRVAEPHWFLGWMGNSGERRDTISLVIWL